MREKMKVFIIFQEDCREKKGLVEQMTASIRENGCSYRLILKSASDTNFINLSENLIEEIRNMDAEEIGMIIPETICGPVLSLESLEEQIRNLDDIIVQLAYSSGIVAFKKEAINCFDFLKWIHNGLTPTELNEFIKTELFDTSHFRKISPNPLMDMPDELIRCLHFPFFSLEVFRRKLNNSINTTLGNQARLLLNELREIGYDEDKLLRYLIATVEQIDLLLTLQLIFILPSDRIELRADKENEEKTLALGMHLYYMDLLEQSKEYAKRFPPETDIIITTSDEKKKEKIECEFSDLECNSLDVRVVENRGRDVSSLLVGMRDLAEWKFVCFYHDKKTVQTKPGTVGVGFGYQCAENLFSSRDYIHNVVNLFQSEKRLGILSPPPPNHSDYYFTMALPWGLNWDVSFALYQRLSLSVPISKDKAPVAPLGTCFWFRGDALRKLLQYGWNYDDFPSESNGVDGTLLHAFERIYPYCAQQEGYYAAYVCSDKFAAVLRTTMMHYLRGYNRMASEYHIINKTEAMLNTIRELI